MFTHESKNMNNDAILKCFFADIKETVPQLNEKEQKLFLPDINAEEKKLTDVDEAQKRLIVGNLKAEEQKVAHLIACAIHCGDVTAVKYFIEQLTKQGKIKQYREKIFRALDTFYGSRKSGSVHDELLNQYKIRFQCRHCVYPALHPCDRNQTLKLFSFKEIKEWEHCGDYGGPGASSAGESPSTYYTPQRIVKKIKDALRNEKMLPKYKINGYMHPVIERLFNCCPQEEVKRITKLFDDGNMALFFAALKQVHDDKDSTPPYREIILFNNVETFSSVMDEFKFSIRKGVNADELMKLAFKNGRIHAVNYLLKKGVKMNIDEEMCDVAIQYERTAMLDYFLEKVQREAKHKGQASVVVQKVFDLVIKHHKNDDNMAIALIKTGLVNVQEEHWNAIFNLQRWRLGDYNWKLACYLAINNVDHFVKNKADIGEIIVRLMYGAHTSERINSLFELCRVLYDKKIDVINLKNGDDSVLFSLAKLHVSQPSPLIRSNVDAKDDAMKQFDNSVASHINLLKFLLEENKADTKELLTRPLTSEKKCFLQIAIEYSYANSAVIIEYLVKLHESCSLAVDHQALSWALNAKHDNISCYLMTRAQIPLSPDLDPNNVVKMVFQGSGDLEKPNEAKAAMAKYLIDHYGADPFQVTRDQLGGSNDPKDRSVIQFLSGEDESVNCLLLMYQIYFDKIADFVKDFLEPKEMCHLVMTYANNMPYFAEQSHVQFFKNKGNRVLPTFEAKEPSAEDKEIPEIPFDLRHGNPHLVTRLKKSL